MPYRVCKTFEVENGHMLSKHPDLCRFPHGHTRKVELVLESDALDKNEMVCDFKVLKETMDAYLKRFDHALCMNTADKSFPKMQQLFGERVMAFENQDPTTELLAKTIYDEFVRRIAEYARSADARYPIGATVRVVKVRVWETSSSWAEYSSTSK